MKFELEKKFQVEKVTYALVYLTPENKNFSSPFLTFFRAPDQIYSIETIKLRKISTLSRTLKQKKKTIKLHIQIAKNVFEK